VTRELAELTAIERLADAAVRVAHIDVLARIDAHPIYAFGFGAADRRAPVLLVTGGVHGLERIGTDVALAYLTSLVSRATWDATLADALARCRVAIVPLVNPVGMALRRRANGRGVDLMRNAPCDEVGGTPLLGGQRLSPRLPWFMGEPGAPMEVESRTLVDWVEREAFSSAFAIALDLHSGFGFVDRLWYPYARTREAPTEQPAIDALARLLDDTLPNHVYRVEQTARAYTIRGDLWDYLFDRRRAHGGGALLPLTLEMGSWAWVRKNPWQGLSRLGRFNPIEPHRHRRTLRRHLPLIEFLHRATASYAAWLPRIDPPPTIAGRY
jgi:hypothetical protein